MADVGERNPNGLLLVRKTGESSGSHRFARIYVVRCGQGHEGGVNGCDFHVRRCPDCDPDARPWEPRAGGGA